jgi:hypothetical protein
MRGSAAAALSCLKTSFRPNSAAVLGGASPSSYRGYPTLSRAPGSVAARPRAPSLDGWHQRMPLLLSVVLRVYRRYENSSVPSTCRMQARADGARCDRRTWQ